MKFCQPSASQSKSTHTRPSSLGSQKLCEPFEPCCFRFSWLVVEKTRQQRSKSSSLVVARNNFASSSLSAPPLDADGAAGLWPRRARRHGGRPSGAREEAEALNRTPIPTVGSARRPRLRHPRRRVEVIRAHPREDGGRIGLESSVFRRGHEHAGGHVARTDTVTKLLRGEAQT